MANASIMLEIRLGRNARKLVRLMEAVREIVDYVPEYCIEAQDDIDEVTKICEELVEDAKIERQIK